MVKQQSPSISRGSLAGQLLDDHPNPSSRPTAATFDLRNAERQPDQFCRAVSEGLPVARKGLSRREALYTGPPARQLLRLGLGNNHRESGGGGCRGGIKWTNRKSYGPEQAALAVVEAAEHEKVETEPGTWRWPDCRLFQTGRDPGQFGAEALSHHRVHRNHLLARSFVLSRAGDQSGSVRKRASNSAINSE